jgi:RHS repeat-associated protein
LNNHRAGKIVIAPGVNPPQSHYQETLFERSVRQSGSSKLVGSTSIYYYHTDQLSSSSVVTDETGTKVQSLTYFPYGQVRGNTGSIDVTRKYTGQELDDSTGLYFYGARYYDPVLGRFISADPTTSRPFDPQALNRYSYARNNPLRFIDPSGHLFEDYTLNCPFCFDTSIGLDYTLDASLTMNSASDSLSSSISTNLTFSDTITYTSLDNTFIGTPITNEALNQVSTPGITLVGYYPNRIDPGSGGAGFYTQVTGVTVTQQGTMNLTFNTNLPKGAQFNFYLALIGNDINAGTNSEVPYTSDNQWSLFMSPQATVGANGQATINNPGIDVTQVQQSFAQYMAIVSDLQVGHAVLFSVFTPYGIQPCQNCPFNTAVSAVPLPENLQSIIPQPNVILPP